MAGLQYNFFPTDFFYPRPQPVALDATRSQASLPLQIHKRNVVNDLEEQPKGNNIRDNKPIKARLHMQVGSMTKIMENISSSHQTHFPGSCGFQKSIKRLLEWCFVTRLCSIIVFINEVCRFFIWLSLVILCQNYSVTHITYKKT